MFFAIIDQLYKTYALLSDKRWNNKSESKYFARQTRLMKIWLYRIWSWTCQKCNERSKSNIWYTRQGKRRESVNLKRLKIKKVVLTWRWHPSPPPRPCCWCWRTRRPLCPDKCWSSRCSRSTRGTWTEPEDNERINCDVMYVWWCWWLVNYCELKRV